jgi:hypothetical protein
MHYYVCYFCAICVILACGAYLIDLQLLKIWVFGSKFKSRRAKPSQAKPTTWEAYKGISSQCQLQKRMVDQSTLGMRPRWTHSQQHHQYHSHSNTPNTANNIVLFVKNKPFFPLSCRLKLNH